MEIKAVTAVTEGATVSADFSIAPSIYHLIRVRSREGRWITIQVDGRCPREVVAMVAAHVRGCTVD